MQTPGIPRNAVSGGAAAALVASWLLVSGCASQPRSADHTVAEATKAQARAHCVRDTGSRIGRKDGACLGSGRVFERDDLERTGALSISEALNRLGAF